MAASAMFTTVYGRSALESEKHLSEVHCIYELARKVPSATFAGAYLVDSYPIMKYLPTWAAEWKREGLKWNERMLEVFSDIIAEAKASRVSFGHFNLLLSVCLIRILDHTDCGRNRG